jgi:hypothetical protein
LSWDGVRPKLGTHLTCGVRYLNGRPIPTNDLRIAATCLCHDPVLHCAALKAEDRLASEASE